MSERIFITLVHEGELTDEELDDLSFAVTGTVQRVIPSARLEEAYTEDAEQ